MKKITALILSIITLAVIICSCGKNTKPIETETDENGDIITTTTTKEQATTKSTSMETTSTTKKSDEFEFPEGHYIKTGYKKTTLLGSAFLETPSRIILTRGPNRHLCYYSKADDGFYTFCFDPLCEHNTINCFSRKFDFGYLTQPVYAEYNNRLYLPFLDCLYSSKFDGTDIRLEFALGDYGKELGKRVNGSEEIKCMQTYDNYVYFTFPVAVYDDSNDFAVKYYHQLYRYNLDTKKLENLFENVGYNNKGSFRAFYLSSGKIFFSDVTNEGMQLFSANIDMTNCHPINIEAKYAMLFENEGVIFDGRRFFSVINSETDDGQEVQYIVAFDPETEKMEIIYTSQIISKQINGQNYNLGHFNINAITEEYIYFSVNEDMFLIGKYKTRDGYGYSYNTYHTTYRIKKDGTDKILVFEGVTNKDPKVTSYSLEEFYFSDSKVIAQLYAYTYSTPVIMPDGSETGDWQKSKFVTFDIAPDGSFVNMHELKLDHDE